MMSKIYFETELYTINLCRILRFPNHASAELPSRGMVMIRGTMNDIYFETALEPDGAGSHWFSVSDSLSKITEADVGDTVSLIVEPMQIWLEPEVPLDLKETLITANLLNEWNKITTRARWEWIRWVRFTNYAATRQKRIETACTLLKSGKSRPCCFDQSRCTDTSVSKNGVLVAFS